MWSDVNFYIESTSLASMHHRFSLMINLIAGDWVNVSHCIYHPRHGSFCFG
jgi:hypothetical protein